MRKITLYVTTSFVGADYEVVVEVPDDTKNNELCEIARNFMRNHFMRNHIACGWYEDTDEDE